MDEKLMKHGAFSWFELMTSDVGSAKEFYTKLLGWTTQEMPMQDSTYTVVEVDGEAVGGITSLPPDPEKMPPAWGIYITVKNVNETVKTARELGGKIFVEPQDIPDVGRFSVIQDPQGAYFAVMEYKQ
jgi:predicted enzyme related to lactoylglutathione lyase